MKCDASECYSNILPQRATIEGPCGLLISRGGVGHNIQDHSEPTVLGNVLSLGNC